MATNVTEKDKTLQEIIDWCEQLEIDGLRLANALLTGARPARSGTQGGKRMSKAIRYVECAHCGETVGSYYVTCPYCGYRLSARKPTTGMDPLYGMTDSEFYKRFGSM